MRKKKHCECENEEEITTFLLSALQVLSSLIAKIESLRVLCFSVLESLGLRPTRPDSLTHFQQQALCSGSLVTSLVISTKQLIDKLLNIIQISTQNKTFFFFYSSPFVASRQFFTYNTELSLLWPESKQMTR